MNPQPPPDSNHPRIQTSILHVSADSHQKIVQINPESKEAPGSLLVRADWEESSELFDAEAGNQVRLENSGGLMIQERPEMGESLVEAEESFQLFQAGDENQVKFESFHGFSVVGNQEMTETVVDLGESFGVTDAKAEILDGFSDNSERDLGENSSEAVLDAKEMSQSVVELMQDVSGDNGAECFRAESDKLSKSQEFAMAESSVQMMEGSALGMSRADEGKSGTDAGNCRAEAMQDHKKVQCDGKQMSSVNVQGQTSVFETRIKGVEHRDLLGTSQNRVGNRARSTEEEKKRKNGVGYNRNVKGKVCWIKVNRDLTGSKKTYSRNEMEALRSMNVEGQQAMWNEVFLRMVPAVAREYEDMVDSKPQKQVCKNFDNRQRFVNKNENGSILGTPKGKGNGYVHSMPRRKENIPMIYVMATY